MTIGEPTILIHYGELTLKGKNRGKFERQLVSNIQATLGAFSRRIEPKHDRMIVWLRSPEGQAEVLNRLRDIPGIAYIALATDLPPGLDNSVTHIPRLFAQTSFETFAIRSRRPNKAVPFSSQTANVEIGQAVGSRLNKRVDLSNPDLTIHVEFLSDRTLVYGDRISGQRGLPVGISGRLACLISGGIDSPVAAYLMIKRGCRISAIHFSSYPYTSQASETKVRRLLARLTSFHSHDIELTIVPFAELQKRIVADVPADYRIICYRRFMLRIAEQIAERQRAPALVTGESLAQVASQTLSNLCSIEASITMPILRPLIGLDKQAIIALAQEIGTFPISIEPDEDCCQFMMPQHPVTTSRATDLERLERNWDIAALCAHALAATTVNRVTHDQAAE